MTSLQRAWLLNGEHHALRVRRDHRLRPIAVELLRKSDEKTIACIRLRNNQPLHQISKKRLPRDAHHELTGLSQRLLLRNCHRQVARNGDAYARRVEMLLRTLNIDPALIADYALPRCPEPALLESAGSDLYGRPLWLTPTAGRALLRLRDVARLDGITLAPVSGYRSAHYQARLIRHKLAQGQSLATILRVSALPGYSEHHLGTTVDLHDGVGPALEERFEASTAFGWLQANAGRYGFHLSYPKYNPWGIAYEPWHWRYHDPLTPA